jgi:hypothetical protein
MLHGMTDQEYFAFQLFKMEDGSRREQFRPWGFADLVFDVFAFGAGGSLTAFTFFARALALPFAPFFFFGRPQSSSENSLRRPNSDYKKRRER